jgi:predicted glutamine amidotransferase
MARIIGIAAAKPTRFHTYLVEGRDSRTTADGGEGWGLAAASDIGWRVSKDGDTAPRDLAFLQTVARMKSKILVGHIRRGSIGLDLAAPVQPLQLGEWVFVHDGRPRDAVYGSSNDPPRTARGVRNGPTSEALFASILTFLDQWGVCDWGPHSVVDRAVAAAVAAVTVREGLSSLNFLLSNGVLLYAFRYGCPLYQLKRNPMIGMPRHVVFASEPLTNEPWAPVPDGTLVRAISRAEDPICVAAFTPHPAGGWVH